MKKTFSLMGLLALLAMPTTLSAQSIFKFTWNDMRGGSYPRQIDERKLAEYCFGSWKCNSLLNLFKQDTVPLQEMKERFYSRVNTKRRTRYFPQNDSVTAIRGVQDVLVNSPLATCPIKKARNMRGVWSYPHLRLVELLDENGKKDSALYRKVADTFTPNVEGYRQGFPTWFEGNVIKLRSPMWYMNFVVSAQPWFYHYEKGKVIIDECDSDCPDYFSSYPRIFDGTWVDNLMEGMPFFSDAINRGHHSFQSPVGELHLSAPHQGGLCLRHRVTAAARTGRGHKESVRGTAKLHDSPTSRPVQAALHVRRPRVPRSLHASLARFTRMGNNRPDSYESEYPGKKKTVNS